MTEPSEPPLPHLEGETPPVVGGRTALHWAFGGVGAFLVPAMLLAFLNGVLGRRIIPPATGIFLCLLGSAAVEGVALFLWFRAWRQPGAWLAFLVAAMMLVFDLSLLYFSAAIYFNLPF